MESALPIPPLLWPPDYPPKNRWKLFFIGVRGLGPDLSFFASLKAQQALRTEHALSAWQEADRPIALMVGRALMEDVGWPTPWFIPTDPFVVVANGPRYQEIDDLGVYTAFREIEEALGLRLSRQFWKAAFEDTVGGVVASLSRQSKQRHGA